MLARLTVAVGLMSAIGGKVRLDPVQKSVFRGRYWGQSGHEVLQRTRRLLTHSRQCHPVRQLELCETYRV
jgi:hypothetical protein